jgi:hypothetical protein
VCVCVIFKIQNVSACFEFKRDKYECFQSSSTTQREMTYLEGLNSAQKSTKSDQKQKQKSTF